jgi:hypothetical protein
MRRESHQSFENYPLTTRARATLLGAEDLADNGTPFCIAVLRIVLHTPTSAAYHILDDLLISMADFKAEVSAAGKASSARPFPAAIGLASVDGCTQLLLESAARETARIGTNYIGTEHLLCGLVSEAGPRCATLFSEFAITREGVRIGMCRLLGIEGKLV